MPDAPLLRLIVFVAVAALSGSLAGCGNNRQVVEAPPPAPPPPPMAPAAEEPTVAAPPPPRRICLNPDKANDAIADYMSKPGHKAMVANLSLMSAEHTTLFSRWSDRDARQAMRAAEQRCRRVAAEEGADPNRCVPVFIDDRNVLDLDPYACR